MLQIMPSVPGVRLKPDDAHPGHVATWRSMLGWTLQLDDCLLATQGVFWVTLVICSICND